MPKKTNDNMRARIVVDEAKGRVTVGGRALEVPRKEYDVLRAFASADGSVLSRERIMERVWGAEVVAAGINTRTVDQHIARLRKRLGRHHVVIVSVVGRGYRAEGVEFAKPAGGVSYCTGCGAEIRGAVAVLKAKKFPLTLETW